MKEWVIFHLTDDEKREIAWAGCTFANIDIPFPFLCALNPFPLGESVPLFQFEDKRGKYFGASCTFARIKASEMLVAPRISECFGLGLL